MSKHQQVRDENTQALRQRIDMLEKQVARLTTPEGLAKEVTGCVARSSGWYVPAELHRVTEVKVIELNEEVETHKARIRELEGERDVLLSWRNLLGTTLANVRAWFGVPSEEEFIPAMAILKGASERLSAIDKAREGEPSDPEGPMTLDEAISHATERAAGNCDDLCAQEHGQLAGWLMQVRDLRDARADERKGRLEAEAEVMDLTKRALKAETKVHDMGNELAEVRTLLGESQKIGTETDREKCELARQLACTQATLSRYQRIEGEVEEVPVPWKDGHVEPTPPGSWESTIQILARRFRTALIAEKAETERLRGQVETLNTLDEQTQDEFKDAAKLKAETESLRSQVADLTRERDASEEWRQNEAIEFQGRMDAARAQVHALYHPVVEAARKTRLFHLKDRDNGGECFAFCPACALEAALASLPKEG